MSRQQIDTRVTAYVFGELSPKAAVAFERELEKSIQLQEEVAAIRETIGAIKSEFDTQGTDVGVTQRAKIEYAIGQKSRAPSPAVLDGQTMSRRRLLAAAALAASVLIVFALAYPYLGDDSTVSMNQNAESAIAVSTPTQTSTVTTEVASLVESFNDLMEDSRFDEAEGVAQRVNELQPGNPISVALLQSSRMARELTTVPTEGLLTPNIVLPPHTPAPGISTPGTSTWC